MRRRISRISAVILLCCMCFVSSMDALARDVRIDGSALTTEEYASGTTESNPLLRGQHLMDGQSAITKTGRGKIYAYGATTADHVVDYIAIIVYVDRYNEETGYWEQIDAWFEEAENTYYISTSKTIYVDRGYYYRVHCDHLAGNVADYPYDEDYSFTDGIWIG